MDSNKVLRILIIVGCLGILVLPLFVAGSLYFPFITGKNFAFRIIVEIITLLWLVLLTRDAGARPKLSTILASITGFALVLGLATIFAQNPYRSFWSNYERMDGYINIIHQFAFFLVLISILKSQKIWDIFFHTSLGIATIVSVYGFTQLAGLAHINQGSVRVDGNFGNATYLAVYMLFHFFLAAYYFVRNYEVKWSRFLYIALAIIYSIILYYTATRGAMLGAITGALFILFVVCWRARGNMRKLAISAILFMVLVATGIYLARDTSFVKESQVLPRFTNISLNPADQPRLIIWRMAIKGALEHPILGWGMENFNILFNKYYQPELWRQETWFDHAHNALIDWLVAAGILGLLSYLFIFVSAIRALLNKNNNDNSDFSLSERTVLGGLLVAYFVQNIFVFDNLISYFMFFSILAYVQFRTSENSKLAIRFSGLKVWFTNLLSKYKHVVSALSLIVFIFAMYFFNIKPIMANRLLIQGLYPRELSEDHFAKMQKVFALNSFGSMEAREQFLFMLIDLRAQASQNQDLYLRALDVGQKQMLEQLKTSGNDARHQLFMGSFMQVFGRRDEALQFYKNAEALSPKKQLTQFSIASIYVEQGKLKEALELAKRTYELDPSYERALVEYAAMAINAGQNSLAIELLIKQYGTAVLANQSIINAYARTGQYDKIIAIWKAKIMAEPQNQQGYLSLAASYYATNKDALAISTLQEMAKLDAKSKETADYYISQIRSGTLPRVSP